MNVEYVRWKANGTERVLCVSRFLSAKEKVGRVFMMNKKTWLVIALVVVLAFALAGCNKAAEPVATAVPATEVPATEVPATEVPATEVPATEVPATEVPATEVPATEVPATEVPATAEPKADIVAEVKELIAADKNAATTKILELFADAKAAEHVVAMAADEDLHAVLSKMSREQPIVKKTLEGLAGDAGVDKVIAGAKKLAEEAEAAKAAAEAKAAEAAAAATDVVAEVKGLIATDKNAATTKILELFADAKAAEHVVKMAADADLNALLSKFYREQPIVKKTLEGLAGDVGVDKVIEGAKKLAADAEAAKAVTEIKQLIESDKNAAITKLLTLAADEKAALEQFPQLAVEPAIAELMMTLRSQQPVMKKAMEALRSDPVIGKLMEAIPTPAPAQ